MTITQLEQSGIILETKSGFTLAIDIGSFTALERLDGLAPDAMIVSHIHGDHFSLPHLQKLAPKKLYLNQECIEALGGEQIASEVVKVQVGDTVTIGDLEVQFFDVDHGPNATRKPQENFGLLISADNEQLYFAGDMFTPSGIDVTELEVTTALLPVGGFYTFGPEESLSFAQQFKRIGTVLPMHYEMNPEVREEFVELAREAGVATR